jgi:hypothetical protein
MAHKEIKFFIHNSLKEEMLELCDEDDLTQAQLIECEMERRAKR